MDRQFKEVGLTINNFEKDLKTVEGEFTAVIKAPFTTTDMESGKERNPELVELQNDSGKLYLFLDGGLKGKIKWGMKIGDYVRITHLGKKNFTTDDGKARQVNDYKVEVAAN